MSNTDDLVANNEAYAASFDKGDLPLPPAKKVAVIACMDARLNVHALLGLSVGDAHIIRNAGGVVTDDAIRSLAISQRLLGTEEIVTIDPTRRFAAVAGDGELLGAGAADRVRAAIASELVGVSQRALDMTLEYVKDRKQFGVPVGSFQSVSHRCAQMLLQTESARSATYFAAWAADADPDRLAEAAAMAAAAAAEAGREVTGSAIQAHGGIGFTWEADVHWLYKRAQLDAALLGGGRRHRAALARLAAARVAVPALS